MLHWSLTISCNTLILTLGSSMGVLVKLFSGRLRWLTGRYGMMFLADAVWASFGASEEQTTALKTELHSDAYR